MGWKRMPPFHTRSQTGSRQSDAPRDASVESLAPATADYARQCGLRPPMRTLPATADSARLALARLLWCTEQPRRATVVVARPAAARTRDPVA